MKVSYNQLEAVLFEHFQIHPDRYSTFRSRVKQLQRLKFPPGVNVGRGAKMEYSARHLFQLVSAFELINCGLPAATATQIVESDWKPLAAAYGLFAKAQRTHLPESTYVLIMNCALAELTGAQSKNKGKVYVTVENLASLENSLKDSDGRTARTFILLCASDITRSVLTACFKTARVEAPAHDAEFDSWLVNYSDENDWMRAEGGWQDFANKASR